MSEIDTKTPMTATTIHDDPAVETTIRIFKTIFGEYGPWDFQIRLWDGTTIGPAPDADRKFTLVLHSPAAVRKLLLPPTELNMGEAYIYKMFDIEGDIFNVFPLADYAGRVNWVKKGRELLKPLLSFPTADEHGDGQQKSHLPLLHGLRHSLRRDKAAIQYHYDVSNDFYALWLDKRMVYSAAYFPTGQEDLDTAQELKLDYICKKLRLQPGERLLDIGCGWGALIMWAAEHYGVRATGITLSENQYQLAKERIAAAGLADRCEVRLQDYRQVKGESYDKLVSVGMFEHVGASKLTTYFRHAYDLLRPGGVFLNHGIALIGKSVPRAIEQKTSFSANYVFPDGELVNINKTLAVMEKTNFEIRDVESLREHYALTLRHWVRRMEAHEEEILQHVPEVTYRIWHLFMAGASYGFASNRQSIYQVLAVKNDQQGHNTLPWSRADWYC